MPITLAVVIGVGGGMGKSLFSDTLRDWSALGGTLAHMIRIENGNRRTEFVGDTFISLDGIEDAALVEGGTTSLFDAAEPVIFSACAQRELAIVDGGANAHNLILNLIGQTDLPELLERRGGGLAVFVLVSPSADSLSQTADLIATIRARLPDTLLVLVKNERMGTFAPDGRGPEAAASARLRDITRGLPSLTLPLVGVRALAAFAATNRPIPEILAASEQDLVVWSGLPLLRALTCQSALASWWQVVVAQLDELPFRTANQ